MVVQEGLCFLGFFLNAIVNFQAFSLCAAASVPLIHFLECSVPPESHSVNKLPIKGRERQGEVFWLFLNTKPQTSLSCKQNEIPFRWFSPEPHFLFCCYGVEWTPDPETMTGSCSLCPLLQLVLWTIVNTRNCFWKLFSTMMESVRQTLLRLEASQNN